MKDNYIYNIDVISDFKSDALKGYIWYMKNDVPNRIQFKGNIEQLLNKIDSITNDVKIANI